MELPCLNKGLFYSILFSLCSLGYFSYVSHIAVIIPNSLKSSSLPKWPQERKSRKKARLSQLQVRITTPDETLCRYHVELFNPATGKAKDAPFEEVNFDLYKPGAKSIAFTTSETRIRLWIRCFIERYYKKEKYEGFRAMWEEQNSSGNADLCDRIILHLYALEGKKEQQVVVITVYISTGTIFVQGKWYQQYGLVEFLLVLEIINEMKGLANPDNFEPQAFSSTLPNFSKQIASPAACVTDGKE